MRTEAGAWMPNAAPSCGSTLVSTIGGLRGLDNRIADPGARALADRQTLAASFAHRAMLRACAAHLSCIGTKKGYFDLCLGRDLGAILILSMMTGQFA